MQADYPKHLTVRLATEQREALRRMAEAREISVSDLVRQLIADRLGE